MQEDMQKDDQLFWSYISSVRTSGTYFFLARDDDIKGSEYQPNPLYRDAYLSELGRAHADSLYLGAQKIVHDTMARLRLTPADEQRKKLNQKHINTQQFDFLRAL